VAAGGGVDVDVSSLALTKDDCVELAKQLQSPALSSVTRIDVSHCELTPNAFTALAPGLQRHAGLTSLVCEANFALADVGAAQIALAVMDHPTLSTLQLSRCMVGPEGGKALAHALRGPATKLHTLVLRFNVIGAEGMRALAEAIGANPRSALHTLDVASNALGDDGAHAVASLLRAHPRLLQLDLSSNQITDVGAGALSVAVRAHPALQTFNVSDNPLRGVGCQALAGCVRAHRSISVLNMSQTQCDDLGARAVADVLSRGDCRLHRLHLTSNSNISAQGAQRLQHALQVRTLCNSTMRCSC